MDLKNFLGYTATTISIVSLIPQIIKTWKSKSTADLSLGMYILGSLGVLFWVLYGVSLSSIQLIITNSVVLLCSLFILILKIKYK
jgi:MtN3 and saliva related transmembrane protein